MRASMPKQISSLIDKRITRDIPAVHRILQSQGRLTYSAANLGVIPLRVVGHLLI